MHTATDGEVPQQWTGMRAMSKGTPLQRSSFEMPPIPEDSDEIDIRVTHNGERPPPARPLPAASCRCAKLVAAASSS